LPGDNDDRRFGAGGGLRLYVQGAKLSNCSWLNCWSNNRGGGIAQVNGEQHYHPGGSRYKTVELTKCIFASDRTEKDGGGLDVREGNILCVNCSFLHNSAGSYGGAVSCLFWGSISFTDTVFVRNVKNDTEATSCIYDQRGGAVMLWAELGTPQGMTFQDCVFLKNKIVQGCGMRKTFFFFIYYFFF
jgi:hypothetical protein